MVWELPPLILHPFHERVPPSARLENSRAALMLSGIIPGDGSDPAELKRRLLNGRYGELRMLYFLGRDVMRWVEQCLEWSTRVPELAGRGDLRQQSFAGLLTANPPDRVRDKLVHRGVDDYVSIFARAIGMNAVFAEPPAAEQLSEEFLSNYHRYADYLYRCYMDSQAHCINDAAQFHFELYASGEYSRMRASRWGDGLG
jgi:hypothetical protein